MESRLPVSILGSFLLGGYALAALFFFSFFSFIDIHMKHSVLLLVRLKDFFFVPSAGALRSMQLG